MQHQRRQVAVSQEPSWQEPKFDFINSSTQNLASVVAAMPCGCWQAAVQALAGQRLCACPKGTLCFDQQGALLVSSQATLAYGQAFNAYTLRLACLLSFGTSPQSFDAAEQQPTTATFAFITHHQRAKASPRRHPCSRHCCCCCPAHACTLCCLDSLDCFTNGQLIQQHVVVAVLPRQEAHVAWWAQHSTA